MSRQRHHRDGGELRRVTLFGAAGLVPEHHHRGHCWRCQQKRRALSGRLAGARPPLERELCRCRPLALPGRSVPELCHNQKKTTDAKTVKAASLHTDGRYAQGHIIPGTRTNGARASSTTTPSSWLADANHRPTCRSYRSAVKTRPASTVDAADRYLQTRRRSLRLALLAALLRWGASLNGPAQRVAPPVGELGAVRGG